VDLAPVQEALARVAGRGGEALAVGVDVGVAVIREPAQVERGVRALRDAAAAGGEQDRAAGEIGGEVVAMGAEGVGEVQLQLRHRGEDLLPQTSHTPATAARTDLLTSRR
jgi:hypothetical protein